MNDGTRRGPRSGRRRGPQPPEEGRDLLKAQVERAAGRDGYVLDEDERHLLHHNLHFAEFGGDDQYFRATRAIVVAARRWRKLANDRLKPIGQTMTRWETLFLVAFTDAALTQNELAHLISVEGPTMVRTLDLLAREGLIERRQSASDRRVTTNSITPQGTKVIEDVMTVTNQLRREILEDIDREKLATAIEVLGQVLRKLDSAR